ncbi:protein of unknown function [Actinacidiphila rubida]|uniref:DUF4440 domain-containing protein n=1 Tax=Actinacidiphila rubida TaxID=310780 RepID=A0A1H8R8H5_9ACTN|nr:nuclear transport factor 2 family protein [Actinacidiphila rubida]SEO62692.1 protein of unknown function [Actinacidiphila rubida]
MPTPTPMPVPAAEPAPGPVAEVTAFMARYEQAANRRVVEDLAPLIAPDATYWFSDGSHQGRGEILAAIARTFATISDEVYEITALEWVVVSARHAVCRYRFSWTGQVEGRPRSGRGRGTSVLTRHGGTWQIQHEHLSP